MTSVLSAGSPLEPARHPVGRRSFVLVDPERDGRLLGVDVWYPSSATTGSPSSYELLPGVRFDSAGAMHESPARPGQYPLIVFSHGRTGMRFAYSMLCEALAARGAVVVSPDHPGDGLVDWLTGTHADDRSNETNRVADAHLLLRALLHGDDAVPVDLSNAIDPDAVVLAGHSYGAYTALATAAGTRGVPAHERVCAVIGYQSYTRTMSDSLLGRLAVPALLAVGEIDTVTPASTDADRPWALLRGVPTWRLDLRGAGHQAVSDIALYAELAHRIPDLPDIVRQYLESTSTDARLPGAPPWRTVMLTQVEATWAFLDVVLGIDAEAGGAMADRLELRDGVVLRRR